MYLCVLCGSESKQRLFFYTALTGLCFLMRVQCVFCAVGSKLLTVWISLVSVVKPERLRLPGRPRLRWKDNIKPDLQNTECGRGLDSSGSG